VEPSSITMISARGSRSSWILASSAGKFDASLNTGTTIEISQPLTMQLIDAVAAVAKFEIEAALDELVPERRLGRGQIIGQKFSQKILTHHEMSNFLPVQRLRNVLRSFCGANRRQEISRQIAAVMKIIPLAIIRSPADKEKVNLRRRLGGAIILKRLLQPKR
jgi:hypothetical protein